MRPLRFRLRLGLLVLSPLALGALGVVRPADARPTAPRPVPASAPFHDCNANGVEDAVDIARGTSSDADLDGVPDECQGAPSPGCRVPIQERDGTSRPGEEV
jgi:hypothetical protein